MVSSRLKVMLSEAIVPAKAGHRFIPGNAHDGQIINDCPSHIGDASMSKVMKPKTFKASILRCGLKDLPHASKRIPIP